MGKRSQLVLFRVIAALATIASLFTATKAGVALGAPALVQAAAVESCVKFEGAELGQDQSETVNGVTVIIDNFVQKPGAPNEFIGFDFTIVGGTASGTVKFGTQRQTFSGSSGTVLIQGQNAISHIEVCVTPTPTNTPTNTPTEAPTEAPTNTPTEAPTEAPTNTPTEAPTEAPTNTPTNTPTTKPCNPEYCGTEINAEIDITAACATANGDGTYTVSGTMKITNNSAGDQSIAILEVADVAYVKGKPASKVTTDAATAPIKTFFEGKVIGKGASLTYNYAIAFSAGANQEFTKQFTLKRFKSVQSNTEVTNAQNAWADFALCAQEVPVTPTPVTETPVTETPVTQTPVTETPVTQTPVTETPVTQTPVTETPVTQTPVTETPVTQTPVTETPVTPTTETESPANTPGGGTTEIAPPTVNQPQAAPESAPAPVTAAAPSAPAPAEAAAPAETRNQAVAGATDEDTAAAPETAARPRAVLGATGMTDGATWLLLTLGLLLMAVGSLIRVRQLHRNS